MTLGLHLRVPEGQELGSRDRVAFAQSPDRVLSANSRMFLVL